MKVLLTGVAGFIGSHTAEALLARGDEVLGLDNFNDYYDPSLKRRNAAQVARAAEARGASFTLVEGDLTQQPILDSLLTPGRVDAVVHLAAWAGVRPSIQRPALYAHVNVTGTTMLLEAARQAGVTRVVLASSSSVYGGRSNVPFAETDPVDRPVSPYAATKKACEVLGYTYHHLYGMDVSALRFFTVYGPRQRPEMAIHRFATLLSRGEAVPMFGDGTTARDYTFIEDIVQGTLAALDQHRGFEVYNLGEERTTTLAELIAKLGRALGVEPRIRQLPLEPGDVPLTCADVSLARARLGYAPRVHVDEGLARFAEWFQREGVR